MNSPTTLSTLPTVAILGRPNVGKSTLFNRLIGRRQSIVHNLPGVTRDRLSSPMGMPDGGTIQLVDTGGLVLDDDHLGINRHVMLAAEECDAMLFVVDGKGGLSAADEAVWQRLRPLGKPTIVVVNKADTRAAQETYNDFYSFGVPEVILVSAEHGEGIVDLLERLAKVVQPVSFDTADDAIKVAIVGRPNVGKSSFLNALIGTEQNLVSPIPGTTRDPVDTLLVTSEHRFLLIDTAGIRRRSKVADAPEELAVMMSRRQISRAEIAALVIEGPIGVTSGDLAIAGAIEELGRAAVVLVNKWDQMNEERNEILERQWPKLDGLLHGPPRLNISAVNGRHVRKFLGLLPPVLDNHRREVSTAELNKVLSAAVARHPAPAERGRPWSFKYATQVSTAPPTFMLFANRTLPSSSSYRRYLEGRLREELSLQGTPVRLVIRGRPPSSRSASRTEPLT